MSTNNSNEETQTSGGRRLILDESARELVRKKWFIRGEEALNDLFEEFILICERSGLDPLRGAIMPMFSVNMSDEGKYLGTSMRPYTSVDGMAELAQGTGLYGGLISIEWCGEDMKWNDVWLSSEPPAAARAKVRRVGTDEPISMVAMRNEFMPNSPGHYWQKMPAHMLGKCAFAIALRWAFPQVLQGIYSSEELDNSISEEAARKLPVRVKAVAPRVKSPQKVDDSSVPQPRVASVAPAARDEDDILNAEDNESEGRVTGLRDALETRVDALYPGVRGWASSMADLPESKFNWLVRDMARPVVTAAPEVWRVWGAVQLIRGEMKESEISVPAVWRADAVAKLAVSPLDEFDEVDFDEEILGKTP